MKPKEKPKQRECLYCGRKCVDVFCSERCANDWVQEFRKAFGEELTC